MRESISKNEQETIIGRCEDEPGWDVYTCSTVFKRKLERFCAKYGIPVTKVDQDGIRATVPIGCVKLSGIPKVSDAQKASGAARLAAYRAAKIGS